MTSNSYPGNLVIIRGRGVSSVRLALGCAAVAGLAGLALSNMPASATPGSVKTGTVKAGTVRAGTVAVVDKAEAVKLAFTQALIVNRQLGNPLSQGELRLRPVPATDLRAAAREGVPSVADIRTRVARDRKNISAHFGSAALLARENHNVDLTMVHFADPNLRALEDGVSQVAFTSVTVSGNTATITAKAHEWTKSVARQTAGGNWLEVSPEGDMIYNAKLSMGPTGTWLVTDMIGGFANGSGP